ncbi:MAG: DUF2240 family protein [Candidatus Thorarchaeota archaeon]|nr:DUF2240 family protein [Candidatus Thorarchaeota archaeon]
MIHLFRTKGGEVSLESAVEFLSFRCRYAPPSEIREMLEAAETSGMISRKEDRIIAGFLFDRQDLPLNLARPIR